MILLGFGNKSRHGKNTAAAAIHEHCTKIQRPCFEVGWADALYKEVNEWLASDVGMMWRERGHHKDNMGYFNPGHPDVPLTDDEELIQIPEWVTPGTPLEDPRAPLGKYPKLLQWWGTEYRRKQDTDYWVKRGAEEIDRLKAKYPNAVILNTDTRFLNEALAIRYRGGELIRVSRVDLNGMNYVDLSRDPFHPSETSLDTFNWDYEIRSKNPALTGELAITIFEFIRGLRGL